MSDEFDHAAFWLPQEILTDSDGEISPGFGSGGRKMSSFGYDAPLESSETQSDEDEHLAELTRLLAWSKLNRFDSVAPSKTNSTGVWDSSGSPQSTLCAGWNGCSCGGHGSSRGSPNAYSPPPTFDLLHAAAGEVCKMRAHEEAMRFNSRSRSMLGEPVSDFAYYLQQQQQSVAQKQLQLERFRQQQILKSNLAAAIAQSQAKERLQQQKQQHLMAHSRVRSTSNGSLGLSSSAWPPLQQAQPQHFQPNGSIFGDGIATGATPTKKESTGTGVFLPRQIGRTQTERPLSKKQPKPKQASPIFVPAKVMHALNLKIEEICTQSKPEVHNLSNSSDFELGLRGQKTSTAGLRSTTRQQASPVNHEIRLPQEWTY